MNTKKELTTKEKILIALEEPNNKFGRMVGGFVGVLFATSMISLGISAATKELSLEKKGEIK